MEWIEKQLIRCPTPVGRDEDSVEYCDEKIEVVAKIKWTAGEQGSEVIIVKLPERCPSCGVFYRTHDIEYFKDVIFDNAEFPAPSEQEEMERRQKAHEQT